MRTHPEVRLNRRTFGGEWEVVRLAKDGRLITDRWPIHPDDAAKLTEAFDALDQPTAAPPEPKPHEEPDPAAGAARASEETK